MIAITLLGGATLAAFTIFHILRLEGEVQRRLEESVHAQASLQELSARLVRAQEDERRAFRANCTMKWASRFPPS